MNNVDLLRVKIQALKIDVMFMNGETERDQEKIKMVLGLLDAAEDELNDMVTI